MEPVVGAVLVKKRKLVIRPLVKIVPRLLVDDLDYFACDAAHRRTIQGISLDKFYTIWRIAIIFQFSRRSS